MGSGLILLVIVGAWLAVLVPMVLRNSDVSGPLGSVDKFHDAMRVLSRRDSSRSHGDKDDARDEPSGQQVGGRARAAAGALHDRLSGWRDRPPPSAAARRRRLLLALLVLSFGTLSGVFLGPIWLLAPHLLADLLLAAFLLHLRRTAAARAERDWRSAMAGRPAAARPAAARPAAARPAAARPAAARPAAARPAAARPAAAARPGSDVVVPRPAAPALRLPVHVAGIPDRMPSRLLPLGAPLPAPLLVPAARADAPAPARGAQGEAWSPVPVPTPTYLSAPAAPRRVVDLTRPGAYADGLADAERELGIVDEGPQLDEILERRRAVNDW